MFGRLFVDQGAPLLVSADRMAIGRVLAQVPAQRFADSVEMALCAAGTAVPPEPAHARCLPTSTGWPPSWSNDRDGALRRGAYRATVSCSLRRPATAATCRPLSARRGRPSTLVSSGPGVVLPAAAEYRAVALGNLGTGLLWSGHLDEAEQRLREGADLRRGHAARGCPDQHVGAPRHHHRGVRAAARGVRSRPESGRPRRRSWLGTAAAGVGGVPRPGDGEPAVEPSSTRRSRDSSRDSANRVSTSCRSARSRSPWRGCTPRRADPPLPATSCTGCGTSSTAGSLRPTWPGGARSPRQRSTWPKDSHAAALHKLRLLESSGGLLPAERFCLARALLAAGETHAADAVLLELRDGERTGVEVDVWVLSALVADRLREDNRALDALQRAVAAGTERRRPPPVRDPRARARAPAAGPPPAGGSGVPTPSCASWSPT